MSPESTFLVSLFNDRFEESIKTGARSLVKRILNSSNSKIELKVLASKTLTFSLLRIDDEMLVAPYMYAHQTPESPRVKVRGRTSSLFKIYGEEFEKLFNLAQPPAPPALTK